VASIRRSTRRVFLAELGLGAAGVALLSACGQPAPPAAPAKPAEAPKPAEAAKPAAPAPAAAAPAKPAEAPKPAAGAPAAAPASGAAAKPAAVAGQTPKSYLLNAVPANLTEAPALAEQVKAGKLPALKDRLPEEPAVVDRKGKYGGVLRSATNAKELFPWTPIKYAGGMHGIPLRLGPDLASWVPNVLKNVEMSPDNKILTAHMRKGLKWSDGHPHTADDWQFWYDNIFMDNDVKPVLPTPFGPWFFVGGQPMKFVKVDDYTFRFEFAGPNPSFPLVNLAHVFGYSHDNAVPAHYLKQFHAKFNDKAADQAKAAGFESWAHWFIAKKEPDQNAEVPRLGAHIIDQVTPQGITYKRNPYYWMVDADGKQLPYLDGMQLERVDDLAVLEAKAVAGNYDFISQSLLVKNFKSYKDGEAKGGYKVYTWLSGKGAEILYNFNMNYPDEHWQKVFRDVRFRRAMSVAINRDEINEVIFFGMATPAQLTAHKTSRAYKEEYAKAWAQYDPELANKLLDEMGLKMDPSSKLRLLPNNQPMQLTFDINGPNPIHEMCIEYWRKIGVQVDVKPVLRTVLRPKIFANQMIMSAWGGDEVIDTLLARRPKWFAPIYGDESTWAPLWARWYFTKGKEGEEPPPEIRQLYDWMDKYAETDDVQYVDMILKSQAENIWTIGTVADAPFPIIVNKDLKGVAEVGYAVWDALWNNQEYPEAFYYDR
jgi:peptide/nickel transport system substrate-binding protein